MESQPELWAELFEAALALPSAERTVFLNNACRKDAALRRRVEELLIEHARAGSFLEHPLFENLCPPLTGPNGTAETLPFTISDQGLPGPGDKRSLEPGHTLLDRFVVVRLIAKGGMGEVYEAEDRFLQGVHVALKIILPHIADDPASKKRFEREVLLARKVNHPHLCPIYEIFHCEQPLPSFFFLTMKLLPGETLAERLRRLNAIPEKEGRSILAQMAAGLAALHDQGVIHRDIKPNNIMLEGSGEGVRLWITDFGLAHAHESETSVRGKYAFAGTPGYIAHELYMGGSPSQASDLYAFGVVMHEVFTGQKPRAAPDGSSIVTSPLLNKAAPLFCANLVRGCLDVDPARRCQAFEQALKPLGLKRRQQKSWTRRQFIAASAAGICAVGISGWAERDALYSLLHPLPGKRFVALLSWPKTTDSRVTPMLTGVLAAIQGRLARIEAMDHDLFVIAPEDVGQTIAEGANFSAVCDSLGANLVLAASGEPGREHFRLLLRVLDPLTGRALRTKSLECAMDDFPLLPARAVHAAASLLNVSEYLGYLTDTERTQPGTDSTAAFTAFQQAEALMKQPNDTGLDAAIEKYKQAVDLDPQYAMAHAQLGIAYGHQYGIRHNSAALELARGNCERALLLEPGLVAGHLALGFVMEQTGDEKGALHEISNALKLDASNPMALSWQAQIYGELGRYAEAENSFKRVLQERPNSWVAYNNWGVVLNELGRYQEAIEKFRAASVAAPGSAQAFGNLGGAFLQIGDFTQATECLKKSLSLKPNDLAAANTSLALRYQGRFAEAIVFAKQAVQLNPSEDTNWLELGDGYTSLHDREGEARAAYMRAAQEAAEHLRVDPRDGPSWMLLALYQLKSGNKTDTPALIRKAESLGATDMDSQLYKARMLELLGRRDEALATLSVCFHKGATSLQFAPFPDMQALRRDPRYLAMAQLAKA
jgi:Tfp pilus assembly protein PilF